MPPVPPKPGRVRAFFVNKDYDPDNEVEMKLQAGDMIFVEEGANEYFNVTCDQKKGKLSSKYSELALNLNLNFVYSKRGQHRECGVSHARGGQTWKSPISPRMLRKQGNKTVKSDYLFRSPLTALINPVPLVSSGHHLMVIWIL
jgi:hypothetical protein